MSSRNLILIPSLIALFIAGCDSNNAESSTDNPSMVLIPAGEFRMGFSQKKFAHDLKYFEHVVYLGSYLIDKYEVTVANYLECIAKNECRQLKSPWPILSDEEYIKALNNSEPITLTNWHDASNYCIRMGKRLPTEAEWEKAARGPKYFINPWGNKPVKQGAASVGLGGPTKVGSFPNDMSPYGVFDMGGNVSEWVADWYSKTYFQRSPKNNPKGPDHSKIKTIRGGHWRLAIGSDIQKTNYLSVVRSGNIPDWISGTLGFRCAKTAATTK